MNKKYLSFILLAVLLVGFSVVVFGGDTPSTDLSSGDGDSSASDTPPQKEDVFKDLREKNGDLKKDNIKELADAFKKRGIELDKNTQTGFGGGPNKEGELTSTLDAKLDGDILTVNKLGDKGGGQVKFNLSEIEARCKKEKGDNGGPCVTLTKEGLVFSNNATIKNGEIKLEGDRGIIVKNLGGRINEIDLSNVKDFKLLGEFKTEGSTIIKDHLDNEFDDGSMSIKMKSGGNLGINATTPVKIFSKEAPSFLAKGEMTFNPKDGKFGATGKVTMNTEETEITFQKGTKENPVNLTSYTGKGTWINNISDLGDRYNFSTDGPIFYQGNKEGEEFFSVTTGDGRDVELSDVNPREVKIMYANVSGKGTISWSYMKNGKNPEGFESTGEFKANQEGFFVKPKKGADTRTIPSLVIDKDGKVVKVEVVEPTQPTARPNTQPGATKVVGSSNGDIVPNGGKTNAAEAITGETYTGTSEQNDKLLNALKKQASESTMLREFYEGMGALFPSVENRASDYSRLVGLQDGETYIGTSEQNDKLLNALKKQASESTMLREFYEGMGVLFPSVESRAFDYDSLVKKKEPLMNELNSGITYPTIPPSSEKSDLNSPTLVNSQPSQEELNIYYNKLFEGIKKQETGGKGIQNFIESIAWHSPFRNQVTTTGPMELSREMSLDIINSWSDSEKNTYFGTTTISQKMVDDFIRTEEGAKTVARSLTESNSKTLENIYKKAGQVAPKIGTEQRIIYDGTSYNTGSIRPIAAGIQYSMEQVGINLPVVPIKVGSTTYKGTIDGFFGDETKNAFKTWINSQNIQLSSSQIDNDFKSVNSFVGSPSWQALNSVYKSKYGTDAKLLVPVEVMKKSSDYKVDNYGLRVLQEVNSKIK